MTTTDFPALETPRLLLRELGPADAPALLRIYGDANAMRWFGTDPLTSLQQAEQQIAAFAGWREQPNPGTRWALQCRSSGALLGSCGLFKWNRSWRSCSLGYELGPAAWGRGLMREALHAVLHWGFEQMELERVEAQIHPDNIASLKLAERLGFAQEGRLRQAGFWLGQRHDLLQLGLLRQDFFQAHDAMPTPDTRIVC